MIIIELGIENGLMIYSKINDKSHGSPRYARDDKTKVIAKKS